MHLRTILLTSALALLATASPLPEPCDDPAHATAASASSTAISTASPTPVADSATDSSSPAVDSTTPVSDSTSTDTSSQPKTAAEILALIAPSSTSCANAPFPSECATADQAAPFLISAFPQYGIYSPAELSALLSLIAFETGDFKYAINHYPGRAGQGTRNMQLASFNLEYALSIPSLASAARALAPSGTTDGLSDDILNQVRALVMPDEYSWASAAWYYATKCASIRSQVQTGGQAGWTAYLGCVGTSATDDRKAYWVRANEAFGITV